MHVPRIETRSLDETVEAIDLHQTPADIVFLSFSDSDLNALARAYDAFPEPKPSLRIASLAALRHPFSVDLYLEKVCARAGAGLSSRCCRGTGDGTRALTKRRHSIVTRSCRSGAISTRAAPTIWRRALRFLPSRLAALRPLRRPSRSAPLAASMRPVSRWGRMERAPSSFSIAPSISPTILLPLRRWRGRFATMGSL